MEQTDQKMLFLLDLQLFGDDDEDSDITEEDFDNAGDTDELDSGEQEKENTKTNDNAEDKDDDPKSKSKMSKEEQSLQAQKRREREKKEREDREEKIKQEAYLKGKLDSTKVNTFTNEPITDEYDLKVYELQKKIESEGGDPIADLPKRLAQAERETANKIKEAKSKEVEEQQHIENDMNSFRKEYPDVDLKGLLEDTMFNRFAKSRIGRSGDENTLIQIYKDFHEFGFKTKAETEAEKNKENATKKGGTPSSNGKKTETKSYSEMTKEEKIAYLKREGLI